MTILTRVLVLLACAALPAVASETPNRVLVVPYQGLGIEANALPRLGDALGSEVSARKWGLADPADAAKQQRAAVMCGEDVECLATLGQRAGARWVLGFGIARIGASVAVSALLVDAPAGHKHQAFLEKLPALPDDLSPLGRRIVESLFKDVPTAPALVPEPPPVSPPVVVVPVEPAHPLRPYAITATVVTGGAGITGGVLGVLAMQNYAKLPDVPVDQRGAANAQQRTLNTGADLAVGLAVVAAATATVLWVVDSRAGTGAQP